MTNISIALESVAFTLPDGTPLFSQLNETFDSRPTGLVGRNGVGKSVLSQILVDENADIVMHSLAVNSPSRRQIAELKDVQLPFVTRFDFPLNLTLTAQQRIGVVGNNGCGKSTLLKVLSGKVEPLEGSCRVVEQHVWLDQHLATLSPQRTVLEQILEANRVAGEGQLRMRLAQIGLDAHKIQIASGLLSGGERLKAALACVLYAEPTPQLLMLDEPGNHLDLPSIQALETMLRHYQGALIVVSHDEVFLNHLNLKERLSLSAGSWRFAAW